MRMKNRAYRANRDNNTQNRFEYRQKQSISTSSALARNETRLVSNETHLLSREKRDASRDGGNLLLSGTVCRRGQQGMLER